MCKGSWMMVWAVIGRYSSKYSVARRYVAEMELPGASPCRGWRLGDSGQRIVQRVPEEFGCGIHSMQMLCVIGVRCAGEIMEFAW